MRRLSLLVLTLLAACNGKQSFDERYQKQSDHISTTANSIEKQVADQISGSAEAERAAAEATAHSPAPTTAPAAP